MFTILDSRRAAKRYRLLIVVYSDIHFNPNRNMVRNRSAQCCMVALGEIQHTMVLQLRGVLRLIEDIIKRVTQTFCTDARGLLRVYRISHTIPTNSRKRIIITG